MMEHLDNNNKEKPSNIHIMMLVCPECKKNIGTAIDLWSKENELRCNCGAITKINIEVGDN